MLFIIKMSLKSLFLQSNYTRKIIFVSFLNSNYVISYQDIKLLVKGI